MNWNISFISVLLIVSIVLFLIGHLYSMLTALIQMALLIACGTFWKFHAPSHISALAHRRALTDIVFYLLLPALVLDVIWRAPLDQSSLHVSLLAATGVITGLISMWLILRIVKTNKTQKGALLLAASFPNATYLGLPVLDKVIGPQSQSIVLQYDLFACTPILLSIGMLLAQHYGAKDTTVHPLRELIKIPPLWAVTIAISLNLSGVQQPDTIHSVLSILAAAVVPLMLIVLGMSIRWRSLHIRFMPMLLPVLVISLILVPMSVLAMSTLIGLAAELTITVVLVAAMPTMIFGIVICERYQLDSELYAAAVTLTTIASLLSLTLWHQWLSIG